ncbi:uncharacterized protein LOC124123264 isoform X3 [Haliotis rufescens]|uniref:uncharacterized protein LOC124123264 isoform X3 n=1 Tax=Haliotis rufescens TaxID=6454 RepID=UPI001EB05848|nr:uncharacterized protein LOC124123264 isoform X3 [Haliotis rufescens]
MSSLIGNIATCAFLLTVYTSMVAGDFEVPEAAEGYIGQSTTLQCKLEGYHRWYVISWIRRRPDGSEVTIVRLPADSKTPEWATGVDYSFKSRIRQKITIETELTEFTLVLRDLQCSDRGMYVCKYVGTSTVQKVLHLSVKAVEVKPATERHDCMKTGSCAMEAVADGEHNRGSSSTLTASLTVMVFLCAAAMVGL